MRTTEINNVQGLTTYVKNNSSWSEATIRNVITALGHNPGGGRESLIELSGSLACCAKHGADSGFPGFSCYPQTIRFFLRNRQDIIKNLELTAGELGENIIGMVQNFGVFRHSSPPSGGEVGKALWDTGKTHDSLSSLYNVFSWFCLEDISNIWYRYLEDNPRPTASREPVSGYYQ